jgi:ribonuclease HI
MLICLLFSYAYAKCGRCGGGFFFFFYPEGHIETTFVWVLENSTNNQAEAYAIL